MSVEISRRRFLTITGVSVGAIALGLASRELPFANHTHQQVIIEPQTDTPTPLPTKTPEPSPSPTATPEAPVISEKMLELQNILKNEIENYGQGQIAVAVTNIKTQESIDVNGNRPQLPGCVANLACALTAVSELSKGTSAFSKDEIEPTLTTMVRHSDPSAGLLVVKAIGGGDIMQGVKTINASMKEWGMYKSFYDHPPAFDTDYSLNNDHNWMVANEINATLTKVARQKLFKSSSFDWNTYALWAMSNNKVGLNFMIPGEIPPDDATVFHKVGWTPGNPNTINDAGVVSANDHRFLYAITFMYQNFQSSISENSLFYGPGFLGRKLSKITYDTLQSG